ncbi:SymE family type I addiction module toxin [Xenorhabdus bovienii]|uniref:SymE family type I addiction module toxin n=1 Tax=Xenorhabdus bovienii TaxID=40576 RepID=UPI0023B27141|nr:SymE family type I addiction module toxin [Xenorhabdus bovienii]MDE9430569.1 type I toxin-antitoxin system SymE family toxin [Xenorhabdus bovienii]
MANTHSNAGTCIYKISQPERYQKVVYRPKGLNRTTPAINLSGNWLSEAGFSVNNPLKIRVMPGCLIITAQNFPELWHCLKSLNEGDWDDIAVADWLRQFPGKLNKTGLRKNT